MLSLRFNGTHQGKHLYWSTCYQRDIWHENDVSSAGDLMHYKCFTLLTLCLGWRIGSSSKWCALLSSSIFAFFGSNTSISSPGLEMHPDTSNGSTIGAGNTAAEGPSFFMVGGICSLSSVLQLLMQTQIFQEEAIAKAMTANTFTQDAKNKEQFGRFLFSSIFPPFGAFYGSHFMMHSHLVVPCTVTPD